MEYDPAKRVSLFNLVRIKRAIEAITGLRADVTTRDSLRPDAKAEIESLVARCFDGEARLRIIQIRHQIDAIQGWTSERTFEDFTSDMMLRNAIERSRKLSGATRRIPATEKAKYPNIPWSDIADIGNYLRHQYHDLNEKILLGRYP